MKPDYTICHYAEIGLKGKNRKYFEEKLVENIKKALPKGVFKNVKRISGRIIIEGRAKGLENVFGISHFSYAYSTKQDIESIKKKAVSILKDQDFKTFRVSAKRSDKSYPLTSTEINEKVGAMIPKKVNLKNPDLTLYIEIVEKYAFLYLSKEKGLSGLPVGVSGKAISLLSGGIDSPVSSFYALKRGVGLVFVHFHAVPYVDRASVEKVKKLAKLLAKFQPGSKLYLVPFGDIQKEVLLKTKADLRVILYRRLMLRIAEQIALKEKAKALVTGESIGQVASQTLDNMSVIQKAVDLPVLRPLVGFDKEEIITKAKEIGTYDISILPHQDCCARFLPQHPATRAKLKDVEGEEKKLDVDKLVKQAEICLIKIQQ